MNVHTRSTQSAKQQQHEVHYSNNDGRTSMHLYIHTAHVHTPFKKKTLSYFNSTYQAFKKKRPVKTKNFPKLGDSVLPRSSCKAPNPAQALPASQDPGFRGRRTVEAMERIPWCPRKPLTLASIIRPGSSPWATDLGSKRLSLLRSQSRWSEQIDQRVQWWKVSVCNCSVTSSLYSCQWYSFQALVRFGLAV